MSDDPAKQPLNEEIMQQIYAWVDDIPLTRPKRNITRDFSDGVMAAELVKHFFPKLVELHNYSTANSVQHKLYNWNTLNQKVFKRLNFSLSKADIDGICNCSQGAIERALYVLKTKIEAKIAHKNSKHAAENEAQNSPQSLTQLQQQQLLQQQQQIQQQIQLLQQLQLQQQQPVFSSSNSSLPQNQNNIIPSYTSQLPIFQEQSLPASKLPQSTKPAPPHLQQQQQIQQQQQQLPQQLQQQQQQTQQPQQSQQSPPQQSQQQQVPPQQIQQLLQYQLQQQQVQSQQTQQQQQQLLLLLQQQQQQQQQQSATKQPNHTPPPFLVDRLTGHSNGASHHEAEYSLVIEKKDQTIKELQSHIDNLQSRIMKLEQIVKIKENKVQQLSHKLQQAGLA